MAVILNGIPTIVIPTDMRILELVNAMKVPSISFEDAMNKTFVSLLELMRAAKKDFIAFETNRIDCLILFANRSEVVPYIILSVNHHLQKPQISQCVPLS